ncbi:MAG: SMC-Scp complex subunit ScpB [Candidatus Magasanikbacteria bacterium]|nr:SMC-Scp complex subunit ScpB [Candidatus Magasanikbacteria bacterium]
MLLATKLESLLFVASKPLTVKKLAKLLGDSEPGVLTALKDLAEKYSTDSGVRLITTGEEWQLATHPDNQTLVENVVKAEVTDELTRPQLETLTVISYCGPITKPELEQIRGVNCSLIIRNLLIRGLVKEVETGVNLVPTYEVTMEYLRHLGLTNISELPDYAALHQHEYITKAMENNQTP